MKQDEFEQYFPDFYADFGYVGHGNLSNAMKNVASTLDVNPGDAFAIVQEQVEKTSYYVRVCWQSICLGNFPCSEEEYEQQIVPVAVIEEVRAFRPPL